MDREQFRQYLHEIYAVDPDQPFEGDFDTEVYRHASNRKWFALVMKIPQKRLGLPSDETIAVVNLKCDPMMIGSMRKERGIYPAYHMNKAHWITAVFSETEEALLKMLVDQSFALTEPKKKKSKTAL